MCECICGTNSQELYWLHILTFFQIKLFKSTLVSPLINLKHRLITPTQGIEIVEFWCKHKTPKRTSNPSEAAKCTKCFIAIVFFLFVFFDDDEGSCLFFPYFIFHFKFSSILLTLPQSWCHICTLVLHLSDGFFSVGYRCMCFFPITDYFLHHRTNATLYWPLKRMQPTEYQNVISSILWTFFFFFNITCKSKRPKQKRYSATECLLALLRNWQKLLQIGLKLGAKISCKSINSTNSNLHLPLHWWEYAEVWEMETKEMFQLQKERKLYP